MTPDRRNQVHSGQEPMAAVPQPLLELIIVPGTSSQDKKALKQVCKLFKQILDDSLTCISLVFGLFELSDRSKKQRCLEKLMQRTQYAHGLRTVQLSARYKLDSIANNLPINVTTLKLHSGGRGNNLDGQALARLPCLTSLILGGMTVTGMGHISGSTHLHCDMPVGCLTHLAPTLKHLSVEDYSHVQNMSQLTSVEILEVRRNMPTDFFQTHGQMPLRCMCIHPTRYNGFFESTEAWRLAPSSLTYLSMGIINSHRLPHVLPENVTHLQLMSLEKRNIDQAAVLLPGLKRLDVCVQTRPWTEDRDAFRHISEFSTLESLNIWYVYDDLTTYTTLGLEKILSNLPGLSDALDRGVNVTAVKGSEDLLDVFQDPWADYANVGTAWAAL